MTAQVIDTSALVKYVLPEQDSSVVEEIVASHHAGTINLMAPEYVLVESTNVLWKQLQRGNIQAEDAAASLQALRGLGIRLIPNAEILEDALTLAAQHGITVYDSLFCAVAVRENAQLITADNPLVRRLTGTGILVTTLPQWNDGG